jgi:hypothetical protein
MSRSEGAMVAVRQILAYPVGFEIELESRALGASLNPSPRELGILSGHSQLLFRIQFADGRNASKDDEAGLRTGRGPMLTACKSETSSGASGEHVRQTLWIWPLPPEGPVTLWCSWPNRGLQDASLVLDGDAIRTAASRAQPFWPESS